MIKAFVFGKFLPFHKGHEALIRFALTQCEFLSVLICSSDQEFIEGIIRKSWIENSFRDVPNLEIIVLDYKESELPNTSESSGEVSKVWANCFKKIFPDHELLVTSEPYGNFVAKFMNIKHISFDQERQQVPISASIIRNDIFSNWRFIPDGVKPFFSIKVVILGTESTGKSTLTKQLANHYACTMVAEAGRELISDSNNFIYEDLLAVAREHAVKINEALAGNYPLVIIDTDIHITKSYSKFVFNKNLDIDQGIIDTNKAQLYLYLNNDVDYVQDGTRLSFADRNNLDQSHRKILQQSNIQFVEIKGNWDKRFEKAVACIDKLIEQKKHDFLTL